MMFIVNTPEYSEYYLVPTVTGEKKKKKNPVTANNLLRRSFKVPTIADLAKRTEYDVSYLQ